MDKKIAKNYIYNTLYQVLSIIAPLITAPYVSRVLHSEGVGLYSYTNTIAVIFSLFAGLGFSAYGQREIAYNQEDKYTRSKIFYEITIFKAFLAVITTLVYVAFSIIYQKYTRYLLPQAVLFIASVFEMSWYFQGLEDFRIIVTRNAIVKVFVIAFTFLLIKSENDVDKYIIIHALSPFISNILYCVVIKKYVEKVKISELHPLRHLKGSVEFFLPLIAVQIYSYVDKLMLGMYMPTTEENGYYEQARKITSIVVAVIVSLNTVMMSRIAHLFAHDEKEKIKTYYQKSFSIIIMLLLPICSGLILISDNFVNWYFGSDFEKVAILLKLSSLLIVFMCIGNFIGIQYLGPTGLQNRMTIAYVIASVCNVVLNVILIPRFFSIGALIASIIAEGVSCAIQGWYMIKGNYRFTLPKDIIKYLVGTCIMVVAITIVHCVFSINGALSTLIDISVGGLTYIVILLVLKESNIYSVINNMKKKRITKI